MLRNNRNAASDRSIGPRGLSGTPPRLLPPSGAGGVTCSVRLILIEIPAYLRQIGEVHIPRYRSMVARDRVVRRSWDSQGLGTIRRRATPGPGFAGLRAVLRYRSQLCHILFSERQFDRPMPPPSTPFWLHRDLYGNLTSRDEFPAIAHPFLRQIRAAHAERFTTAVCSTS
jgi:hypothetical protein